MDFKKTLDSVPAIIAFVVSSAIAKEKGAKVAKHHVQSLSKLCRRLTASNDDRISTEEKLPFSRLAQSAIEFFLTYLTPRPLVQVDVTPLIAIVAETRKFVMSWLGKCFSPSTIAEVCAALDALDPSVWNRLFNAPELSDQRAALLRIMPLATDRVVKHGFLRKQADYSQTTQVRYFILVLRSNDNDTNTKSNLSFRNGNGSVAGGGGRSRTITCKNRAAVVVDSPSSTTRSVSRTRGFTLRNFLNRGKSKDSGDNIVLERVDGKQQVEVREEVAGQSEEPESYIDHEWRDSHNSSGNGGSVSIGSSGSGSNPFHTTTNNGGGIERESGTTTDSARSSTTLLNDSARNSESGSNAVLLGGLPRRDDDDDDEKCAILMYYSEKNVKTVELTDYRITSDNVTHFTSLHYSFILLPPPGLIGTVILEAMTKEIREEWMHALKNVGLLTTQISAAKVMEKQHALVRMANAVEQVAEKAKQQATRLATLNEGSIGGLRNDAITQKLQNDQAADHLLRNCAVFGAPLSGAVAIMRGVLNLHGDAFRQETVHLPTIRKLIWDNLRTIVTECGNLPGDLDDFRRMFVSPDSDLPMAAKLLHRMWNCPEVQEVFGSRRRDLMPNLAYFLDRVDYLFDDGYVLSEEDINKCSLAHVGTPVEKFSFKLRGGEFQFVHLQTTLNNKMLINFEGMAFLVWVVSLLDWEQVDTKTRYPHLSQDRREFHRVINLKPFAEVPVVCILNWSDRFLARLSDEKTRAKFRHLYEEKDVSPAKLLENTVERYWYKIDAKRRAVPTCNVVTPASGVESAVSQLLGYVIDLNRNQVLQKNLNVPLF